MSQNGNPNQSLSDPEIRKTSNDLADSGTSRTLGFIIGFFGIYFLVIALFSLLSITVLQSSDAVTGAMSDKDLYSLIITITSKDIDAFEEGYFAMLDEYFKSEDEEVINNFCDQPDLTRFMMIEVSTDDEDGTSSGAGAVARRASAVCAAYALIALNRLGCVAPLQNAAQCLLERHSEALSDGVAQLPRALSRA